jgi:hypothetical protein
VQALSRNLIVVTVAACGATLILAGLFPPLRLQGVQANPSLIEAIWDESEQAFIGQFELINGTSSPVYPALEAGCGCESSTLPSELSPFSQVSADLVLPLNKLSAGSRYLVPLIDKRTGKRIKIVAYLRAPMEST